MCFLFSGIPNKAHITLVDKAISSTNLKRRRNGKVFKPDCRQKITSRKQQIFCPARTSREVPLSDNFGNKLKTSDSDDEYLRTDSKEKPFTCDKCYKIFRFKSTFHYHMKLHSNARLFSCEMCGKQFKMRRYLANHLRAHAREKGFSSIKRVKNKKVHLCEICGKSFSCEQLLNKHATVHTVQVEHCYSKYSEKRPTLDSSACDQQYCERDPSQLSRQRAHFREMPFFCVTCGKTFRRENHLTNHLRYHTGHSGSQKSFLCEKCGSRFKVKENLVKHLTVHSRESRANKVTSSGETCEKLLKHDLMIHRLVDMGVPASGLINYSKTLLKSCGSSVSNRSDLVLSGNEAFFPYDTFGKHFGSRKALSGYYQASSTSDVLKTYSSKLVTSCKIPGNTYPSVSSELENASAPKGYSEVLANVPYKIKNVFRQDLPQDTWRKYISCDSIRNEGLHTKFDERLQDQCLLEIPPSLQATPNSDTFDTSESINAYQDGHFNIVDKRKNVISCKTCADKFDCESNLDKHFMEAHSGKMPFTCVQCRKGFKYYPLYVMHRISHAGKTNALFPCEECGLVFASKSTLDEHLKISEMHNTCEACGKGFQSQFSLKVHQFLVHARKTETSCAKCQKTFSYWSDLSQHMKTHCKDTDTANKTNGKIIKVKPNSISTIKSSAFICIICNKVFTCQLNLDDHMKVHIDNTETCGKMRQVDCEQRSNHQSDLNGYFKNSHPDEGQLPCEPCGSATDVDPNPDLPENKLILTFRKYEKTLSPQLDSSKHVKTGSAEAFVVSEVSERGSMLHPSKKLSENTMTSSSDKNVFNGQSDFSERVKKDSDKLCFTCKTCGKDFKSDSDLKVHHLDHSENAAEKTATTSSCHSSIDGQFKNHFNEMQFICKSCKKGFKSKVEQTAHDYIVHGMVRVCSKLDKTSQSVPFHPEEHLEPKASLICKTCGKSFKSINKLKTHHAVHLEKSEVKLNSHLKVQSRDSSSEVSEASSSSKSALTLAQNAMTLTCGKCEETFDCQTDLNEHLKTRSARTHITCEESKERCLVNTHNTGLSCCKCTKLFDSKSDFNSHLEECHPNERQSTLLTCGIPLLSYLPSVIFFCGKCNMAFIHRSDYTKHKKFHRGGHFKIPPNEMQFGCNHCQRWFESNAELKSHTCVADGKAQMSSLDKSEGQPSPKRRKEHFTCATCGYIFRSYLALMIHQSTHADITGKVYSRTTVFTCESCGKHFASDYMLRTHKVRAHTKTDELVCSVCQKRFVSKSSLRVHRRIHSLETFSCNKCHRMFRLKSSYVKHLAVHCDKSVVCERCGKTFWPLKDKKRKFSCDSCEKKLPLSLDLSEKYHFYDSGIPFFKCKMCGKRLKNKQAVVRHHKFHTKSITVTRVNDKTVYGDKCKNQFSCQKCDKRFVSLSELDEHLMRSCKVTCLACNKCGIKFKSDFDRMTHCLVHTGNTVTFSCQKCCKTFSQESDLLEHLKAHSDNVHSAGKAHEPSIKPTTSDLVDVSENAISSHGKCAKTFDGQSEHLGNEAFSAGENSGDKFNSSRNPMLSEAQTKFFYGQCKDTFASESAFDEHRKTHSSETSLDSNNSLALSEIPATFYCNTCKNAFTSQLRLDAHLGKQSLETCGGSSSSNHDQQLSENHINLSCGKYMDTCGSQFDLDEHLKADNFEPCKLTYSSNPDQPFSENPTVSSYGKCEGMLNITSDLSECDETRRNNKTFAARFKLNHDQVLSETVTAFPYEKCKKGFSRQSDLHEHLNFHNCKIICDSETGETSQTKSNSDDLVSENPVSFPCRKCNKTFSCRSVLYKHLTDHSDEMDFVGTDSIETHVTTKKQENNGNSNVHPAHNHTSSCSKCDKTFSCQSDLDEHLKLHSDEIKFACAKCGVIIKSHSDMMKHRLIHAGNMVVSTDKHDVGSNGISDSEEQAKCHSDKTLCNSERYEETAVSDAEKISRNMLTLPCLVCKRTFICQPELDDHLKIHFSEKRQPLEIDTTYLEPSTEQMLSGSTVTISCLKCEKTFSHQSDLAGHMMSHSTEVTPCISERNGTGLKSNADQILLKTLSVFTCRRCKKGFSHQSNTDEHLKTHSAETTLSSVACTESNSDKMVSENSQHYLCVRCNQTVSHQSDSKEHLKAHSEKTQCVTTETCATIFNSNSDEAVSKNSTQLNSAPHIVGHLCVDDGCHETFSNQSDLEEHLKTRSKEAERATEPLTSLRSNSDETLSEDSVRLNSSPLQVEHLGIHRMCSKTFTNQLEEHSNSHSKEPNRTTETLTGFRSNYDGTVSEDKIKLISTPDIIELLGANSVETSSVNRKMLDSTANRISDMSQHKETGSDAKDFSCEASEHRFSSNSDLRVHAEKVSCGRRKDTDTSNLQSDLYEHMKTHSDKGQFACDTCRRQFSSKFDLMAHCEIHSRNVERFSCDQCEETFTLMSDFIKHLTIHCDEFVFACETCGERFEHKFHLSIHQASHRKKKTFSCVTCGREFRLERSLNNHLKAHYRSSDQTFPMGTEQINVEVDMGKITQKG